MSGAARRGLGRFVAAGGLLTVLCVAAEGQVGARLGRPGDQRPEIPGFEAPDAPRSQVLPRLELPREPGTESLSGGDRIHVTGYRFNGNTVYSDDELAAIAAPFTDRMVRFADLEALRDRLTLTYVDDGYLTSGAVIPDQTISNGIVTLNIVEGSVTRIDVSGNARLVPSYISSRAALGTRAPVQVHRLEERLQILQQDPRIAAVDAQLVPGDRRGESALKLTVSEAPASEFRFEAGNMEAPAIGGWHVLFGFRHRNLTGVGDGVDLSYTRGQGLRVFNAVYEVPLNAHDTTLEVQAEQGRSRVVEEPLDALRIESSFQTVGFGVRHPVYRTRSSRLDLSVFAQRRHTRSALLGIPFSFSPGQRQGKADVTVLRFIQDWTSSNSRQALAVRSTFSLGIDALGATVNSGSTPDGRFLSWLGQVHHARRLPVLSGQLIVRGDLQLSADPLLTMERIAVGGSETVRGYREDALVADNAMIGSAEVRVPMWRDGGGAIRIDAAGFVDFGRAWNKGRYNQGVTLASVGVGLRFRYSSRGLVEAYWARPLRERPPRVGHNLQDEGVHLRMVLRR